MKRGKYEAPRQKNPFAAFFWIILVVFLILGALVLLKSCGKANEEQTPPKGGQTTPQQAQAATTDPSTIPATQPETTPTTIPETEPSTEPTEPVTEPTEPVTEPAEPPTEPEEEEDPPAVDNTLGLAVVTTARSALGKPYASGGNGPDSFDTSGFISYCFRENGISVPRGTATLAARGEAVEKEDLQPGDVVFFYQSTPGKAEYPGIYTGDGTFIAVSSSQNAVLERSMTSSYYTEHYVSARRFITD